MGSLNMSKDEREAFLADLHVGIASVSDGERGPITVPVWYAYEPGGTVRFTTGTDSPKARRLRDTGRMSLCVQRETAPYAYVTVEGPVEFSEPDFERDNRPIAERYLGKQGAEAYFGGRSDTSGSVLVTLQPEHWLSVDYAKR